MSLKGLRLEFLSMSGMGDVWERSVVVVLVGYQDVRPIEPT